MATRIIPVYHLDGKPAKAEAWCRPNALLFEIVEGEHAGKRGPDTEIHDLVGEIRVDWAARSIYETGEHQPV
jgi:hypothetical protein